MINILLLIPDSLKKPMGGMGEQCRQFLNVFDNNFYFNIIGGGKEIDKGNNYSFLFINSCCKSGISIDPLTRGILNQISFYKTGAEQEKPDIIHAFDWSTFLAGQQLAEHWNIPLVITVQLSISKMFNPKEGMNISDYQLLPYQAVSAVEMDGLINANHIIFNSEFYAKSFPFIFWPKSSVIRNGINLEEWRNPQKVQLPGNRPIKLVYIGRFDTMKNVQTLINLDLPSEIDLIFIGCLKGSNPELCDIIQSINGKKEGFHYIGPKYGQDKVNCLCLADAIIVPSLHEPFGIVALEALAAKTILLSSFRGGMGDFLNEETAINCGTTKESIELSLNKLINLTKEERQIRIQNGLEVCNNHQWKTQADKMRDVYNHVLSQKV